MDFLVDTLDKKKLFFVQTIFESEHHICTLETLLQKLEVNSQTAMSIFHSILEDIRLSDFSRLIDLSYSSSNRLFQLRLSESFNIQNFSNFYIQRSTKFKLLKTLLLTTFDTLQDAADSLHVSYSQVRRIISDLNFSFKPIGLRIHSRRNVSLDGNEINLRFFYTALYLATYGIGHWPFSSFTYLDLSRLLDDCPDEIFKSRSLDKSVLIHYYLAIHLMRERQGFRIDNETISIPLYKPFSPLNKKAFSKFSSTIGKYLPHHSEERLVDEAHLICSSLLALGGYAPIEEVPDFFLLDDRLNEHKFAYKAFQIVDRVNDHLSVPMTDKERNKILYSILCLHYRISLIGEPLNYIQRLLPYYTHETLDLRKKHKIQQIKRLVKAEMDSSVDDWGKDFYDYLISQYCLIYDKQLQLGTHTLPITVAFVSIISNQTLQNDVCQYFSSFFNLKVVDSIDEQVDIIISEVAISNDTISVLRLHQPIIYCHQQLVQSDYEKITEALADIAKKKFISPLS
ncbi:helix-turn-helix domain-containing protein [Enterococcus sp.]|uniref:helix-turn-helix domain-containing protein n=1 Tax=Enterococcus sp. TaxID=35783 RepID=UPI0029085C47|nr:helix-turn-helix domain-containing protein [Enterococcus sp.]MDU5333442.1 helix-turn-helix domain-containing protein [Enterococcus sp.]